jgi:hypothetical protein
MTTTSMLTLSQLTSTAVASYGVDLNKKDLKTTLVNGAANFTSTQADQFLAKYELVDQLQNIPKNGFSATIFQDKNGNKVFAIRITGVRTKLNPTMFNALRAKESGFNCTLTPVILFQKVRERGDLARSVHFKFLRLLL